MTEVLALDSVARRFGRRRVVQAASLSVHAGRIVGLFGRNGCGKTTVLRIACGVLRADSGHVRVHGRVVPQPRLHRLACEGVFLLPERGLLGPIATVGDHFGRIAARWGGASGSGESGERSSPDGDVIQAAAVAPFLDRRSSRLSGGERRRVELALALARRPAVLLADEPLHGIAPRDAEHVADLLRALRAAGCGVLVTGHEVESLLDLVDEVVWMSAGTTHALGAPGAARAHHSFRMDYLGPPRGRIHG